MRQLAEATKSKNNASQIKKTIAVRITSKELETRILNLAKEHNLSVNMTINMLLGYAFNQADKEKKQFTQKIVFETK